MFSAVAGCGVSKQDYLLLTFPITGRRSLHGRECRMIEGDRLADAAAFDNLAKAIEQTARRG